jgi:hypothetical protein
MRVTRTNGKARIRSREDLMLKLIAAAITAAALMTLPTLASAQTAAPAAKTEKTTNAKTKKTLSPAQAAMRDRQKKCGAEWKAAKAAGKIQKGQTWPQYWSACNKRLKGA